MASGTTRISDLIVPAIFNPAVQQMTQQKSRLIQCGAIARDSMYDKLLSGAGSTFNLSSLKDLDDDAENISTDNPSDVSTPNKIGSATEIQVRLSRNNSWSTMDLASDLSLLDPMQGIVNRVSSYWARRLQGAFVATMKGVFADNAAAPAGSEHVQGDLTLDISGTEYSKGTTDFSASSFIDATLKMGDSMEDLTLVVVHSVVYARMLKNNMIDFIPVAINDQVIKVATFLGREVVVDDGMPAAGGVFESWLFGAGAIRLGVGAPAVPTETSRIAGAGNGSGQDILHNRVEWLIHPCGHAYVGTAAAGGPSNAATSNNLANADAWKRVFTERKQIQIGRLVTREF